MDIDCALVSIVDKQPEIINMIDFIVKQNLYFSENFIRQFALLEKRLIKLYLFILVYLRFYLYSTTNKANLR